MLLKYSANETTKNEADYFKRMKEKIKIKIRKS